MGGLSVLSASLLRTLQPLFLKLAAFSLFCTCTTINQSSVLVLLT